MSGLTVDLDDTLTTKADRLFALCAATGDMDGVAGGGHGLYLDDTRFLRSWKLRVGGVPAVALAASADRDRSVSALTNPPLDLDDGVRLPERSLLVRRERVLADGAVETLRIRSFARAPVRLALDLEFDSEFEDVFVVRGVPRGRRGVLAPPAWSGPELRLRYDGADGRTRTATIAFDPAPTAVAGGCASYALVLPAGGEVEVRVVVTLREDGGMGALPGPAPAPLAGCAVETDNPLFDGAMRRSLDDLRMLVTAQDGARFAAAGVPWYVALFGRDSLIAALQALAYDHQLAADTLRALARHQGRVHDAGRGEEPGKIPHELRVGEMARLGELPFAPSFATVDATPLFVCLVAAQVRWSGDVDLWRSLRGAVEGALEWIERGGDHDGDGFLDYDGLGGGGLYNQGWKDSGNAIVNADGSMPAPPIALVEVQAYAYRARLDAAWLLRLDGDLAEAERLEAEAGDLRERFLRAFWLPDRGRLALARQAGGRPVDVLASNAGHALWAGILDSGRAAAVAEALLGDALFSGWGVRTLGAGEVAYNPLDYQLGAIWPHDSAIVAAGLKRYGHVDGALAIFSGLFDAAVRFPLQRLPELFAGLSRREFPEPVRWPAACSPQAWAAGSLPYLLHSALGLEADAPRERLVVRRPALPSWLGRVVWRGVRVGAGQVDLRFTREDGTAARVEVLDRSGPLTVSVEE